MRKILFLIIVPIHYILGMPLLGIAFFVGLFNMETRMNIAFTFNRLTGWLFFTLAGAKFKTYGLDNLPKDEPVLYVGNHTSMLDIPCLVRFVHGRVNFVGKQSVKKWPGIGWWMVANNGLFLDRSSPRAGLKTILEGIERLKKGESFAIYPEGTRSHDDNLLPFKQGSLKLASKSGVRVVPIAVRGTADVFENNGFNLKAETVYVSVGEPITLTDLSKEDQQKSALYVRNIIEKMYNDLIAQQKADKGI